MQNVGHFEAWALEQAWLQTCMTVDETCKGAALKSTTGFREWSIEWSNDVASTHSWNKLSVVDSLVSLTFRGTQWRSFWKLVAPRHQKSQPVADICVKCTYDESKITNPVFLVLIQMCCIAWYVRYVVQYYVQYVVRYYVWYVVVYPIGRVWLLILRFWPVFTWIELEYLKLASS